MGVQRTKQIYSRLGAKLRYIGVARSARAIFMVMALTIAGTIVAQVPTRTFPDWRTPTMAQGLAVGSWAGQVEAYLAQDGTDIGNLQSAVGAPSTGILDQIAALDARVTKLENPQVPPQPQVQTIKLIDPVNLPSGPLVGTVDGLGWSTGWAAMSDGVAPTAQGSRTFTLPSNTTLVSLTVTCSVQCQFTIKDTLNGFTWQSPVIQPALGVQAQVSWTAHSGPVSVTMNSGAAVNLRLTQVQYQ